jgi:hypothetical protein
VSEGKDNVGGDLLLYQQGRKNSIMFWVVAIVLSSSRGSIKRKTRLRSNLEARDLSLGFIGSALYSLSLRGRAVVDDGSNYQYLLERVDDNSSLF